MQSFFHFIQFEGFDNGFNFFHNLSLFCYGLRLHFKTDRPPFKLDSAGQLAVACPRKLNFFWPICRVKARPAGNGWRTSMPILANLHLQ
jgi:hypothetical protein